MLRRKFSDTLESWRRDRRGKALLVQGPRQVGKTTAVREFGKGYGRYVELNFERSPSLRRLFDGDLDSDSLARRIRETLGDDAVEPGDTLLFLDEVQWCPRARTAMKPLAEDGVFDTVASGSLLGVNYAEVPSYPVGAVRRESMHSMDFEEFLWAFGVSQETIDSAREAIRLKEPMDGYTLDLMDRYYWRYLAVGGMPSVVSGLAAGGDLRSAMAEAGDIVSDYRDDVGKYSPAKDRNRIFQCFDSLPVQIAQDAKRFQYSLIDQESGAEAGSKQYGDAVKWLLDSGVCHACRRVSETSFPLRGSDRLFKLYVHDPGILMSMYPEGTLRAVLDPGSRANLGYLAENCTADLMASAGLPLMYYKRKSAEVDFITDLGGEVAGIEVKTGVNSKAKSLDSVRDRGLVSRTIRLEPCNVGVDGRGTEHYPLFAAGFMDSMFEEWDPRLL